MRRVLRQVMTGLVSILERMRRSSAAVNSGDTERGERKRLGGAG